MLRLISGVLGSVLLTCAVLVGLIGGLLFALAGAVNQVE